MIQVELEIRLDGVDALAKKTRGAAAQLVAETAFYAQGAAQELVQTGKRSGRLYRRGKRRKHRASAPGEPPATDYGNLANAIKAEVEPGALRAEVVSGAEYAAALEWGTSDGRLQPRPYMRPARKAAEEFAQKRLGELLG